MACGLFGKLPSKRDFIAVNVPREFLSIWEVWLQGGVSASKIALGAQWLPAYLSAPLWRFWLGADICGMPVTGVFMSSVDGVGRHFPLTVFACADTSDAFLLPSDEGAGAWYESAEDFLLGMLEPGAAYDASLAALEALPLPARRPAPAADATVVRLFGASVVRSADVAEIVRGVEQLEAEGQRCQHLRQSVWWTIGGQDFAPAMVLAQGLPDPHILGAMLNGTFQAPETEA